MFDYIEEIIQVPNQKQEEIESLFINEKLSEVERVSYILKKGQPIQREVLLTNLPFYVGKKHCLETIVHLTIDFVEIWSENLQIIFSKALVKLFKSEEEENLYTNTLNIIDKIISCVITLITTAAEEISEEFLKVFDSIVDFYANYKKINLSEDTIEMAISLGAFGRSLRERRFSVYLCSGLIRLLENPSEDLINRIFIISTSPDKLLRAEVVHNLPFLFQLYDESFVKHNMFSILDLYLEEESHYIWLETVLTTIEFLNFFTEEKNLLNKLNNRMTSHFKSLKDHKVQDSLLPFYKKIFLGMIKNNPINPEENNFLYQIISFLTTFILSGKYDNDNTYDFNFIVEEYELVSSILKSKNENLVNELFITITTNKNMFNNKCIISNLYSLVVNLEIQFVNKNLICKLYNLLNYPKEEKIIISHLLENISTLLEFTEKSENEETIMLFWNSFSKFEEFLMQNETNWRDTVNFIQALSNVEFIYSINEKSTENLLSFLKKHYQRENFQIRNSLIKFLVQIVKYAKEPVQAEALKFLSSEILDNNSFYHKRFFITFIEKAIEVFSLTFFKDKGLINHFLTFLNLDSNANNLLIKRTLTLLKSFLVVFHKDNEINFSILKKLDNLRRYSKDSEVIEAMREYDLWNSEFIKESRKNTFEEAIQSDILKHKQEQKFFTRDVVYIKSLKKVSDPNINENKSKTSSKKALTMVKSPIIDKTSPNNLLFKKNSTPQQKIQSSKHLNSLNFKSPILKKESTLKLQPVKTMKLSDSNIINVKDSMINFEKNDKSTNVVEKSPTNPKDKIRKDSGNNYSILVNGVTVDVESKTITRRNSITNAASLQTDLKKINK